MEKDFAQYPDFKKVTIGDKDFFSSFCKEFPSYSDFNILSLLSWNANEDNSFSILDENLVIRIKDYLGEGNVYSILGRNNIEESLHTLLQDMPQLSFVPEDVILNLSSSEDFDIQPDRDSFDYIYSTQKVCETQGPKFKHLRQEINIFTRMFPKYEVKPLDINDSQVLKEIQDLSHKWFLDKGFDEEKIIEEGGIINTYFKHLPFFESITLGLYVEGVMAAYLSSEVLNKEIVLSHFGASNRDYNSSFYMMEYVTAKFLFENGYKFQNVEQDTGLEGLRKAKVSYNPDHFLKKYTITKKV